MGKLVRWFLVTLCVLTMISGNMTSVAAFARADFCAHDHGRSQFHAVPVHQHHHDHGCPACCLGACAIVAGPRPFALTTATAAAAGSVIYWEQNTSLAGRSIPPDPVPPRTRT